MHADIAAWPRLSLVQRSANCELLSSNKAKLRDFQISLSIVQGELPAEEHQKANFESDVLGGLWFLEEDSFVHGWFYLKPNNYAAVWDQVRAGGYVRLRNLSRGRTDTGRLERAAPGTQAGGFAYRALTITSGSNSDFI